MGDILSIALTGILCIIGFLWLKTTILIVRQKKAAIIEVFGKFWTVKNSGLNFILPWPLASVANIVDLEIKQLEPLISVKSKDNAFLKIPVKVQYQVIPEKIREANYELSNPEKQIIAYVTNTVFNKATSCSMDELFSIKADFNKEVKDQLNEKFIPYGFKIVDLLIDAAIPSEELAISFNNVLVAKRKKDASQNEAEALKIQLVGEAEAEKAALILKSEAFTEYRSKIAEGNREAMAIMLGIGKNSKKVSKVVENGVETEKIENVFEIIPEKDRISTVLNERDILKFFENLDLREAIRTVGKNEGNVIITSGSTGGGNTSMEEMLALTKTLNRNQQNKILDIANVLNEEMEVISKRNEMSDIEKDKIFEIIKKLNKKIRALEEGNKSDS